MPGSPRFLPLVALVVAGPAWAEDHSDTNLQVLYGVGFHDAGYGLDTDDGRLLTLTFEHFGTWAAGDNYVFLDLYHGAFADGRAVRLYAEWCTRVGLARVAGRDRLLGPIRDVSIALELDRGSDGYWANLAGIGVDLALPPGFVLGANVFVRDDLYNRPTGQVTAYWAVPFHLGRAGFAFAGYVDVAGTDDAGVDVGAQPQLLLDVASLLLGRPGAVQVGTEVHLHRSRDLRLAAPQAVLKWTW